MKIILYILVVLIVFCGAVAGVLYSQGALTKDAMLSLVGKEPAPEQGETLPAPSGEPLLPIAAALKEKEKQLAEREKVIVAEEERLQQERTSFETQRKNLDSLLTQLKTQLEALDQDEATRLSTLGKTYEEMEAAKAAKILEQMTVDEAVKILQQISKAKARAKIVEQMSNALKVSETLMAPPQTQN